MKKRALARMARISDIGPLRLPAGGMPTRTGETLALPVLLSPRPAPMKLAQLKSMLYQVRNSVFHGGKVPSDLNDDRIVKAATPVLALICERLVPEHPE